MKKILFISHCLKTGGGQLRLKDIVLGIDKNDFSSVLWSPYDGELRQDYEKENIPVIIKDFYADKINRETEFEFTQSMKISVSSLIEEFRKNKKKLAIRCAGNITHKLLSEFDFSGVDITGIYDKNPSLINQDINGYKIYPVDNLKNTYVDAVLIAHTKPDFFKKELKKTKNYAFFNESLDERFIKTLLFLGSLVKSMIFFNKIKPDIIFLNNSRSFWLVLAGKILGKKIIWVIRESFDPRTAKYFPMPLYYLSFKMADKIIFPSHATLNLYKDLISGYNKAETIHDGLHYEEIEVFNDHKQLILTKNELNIPQNYKVVSCIGTVEERKGQIYLIKAGINYLKNSKLKDCIFLLVGSKNDEYSAKIRALIEESGFKDNFRILPVIKPAYKYLNISDIFVCSSIIEAFPNVVLEAMALKKPIIATNIYGIPEAITHNISGILIPVENMEKHIEENLIYLLNNPTIMQKLGQNAYEAFIEKFTFNIMIKKFEEIINSYLIVS